MRLSFKRGMLAPRALGMGAALMTVVVTAMAALSIPMRPLPVNAQDFLVTNTPRPTIPASTPAPQIPATLEAIVEPTDEPFVLPSVAPNGFDPSVCTSFTDGGPLSAECIDMMERFPRPDVEAIDMDGYTLDTYRFYRVGPDETPTYDAPGGNVNGAIPAGFNFVRAVDTSVADWIQVDTGNWIPLSLTREASPSYFRGVTFTENTLFPFAWVLDLSQIYVSSYPGGPADSATGRWLHRYELVNIFATATDAEGWHWYMIGPNQWVEQRFVAKVQPVARPEGVSGRWVAVDLYEQTLVAYEGNHPVYATLISSGLPHHETNQGLFHVWARIPRDAMSGATGAPSAYSIQSVPWVMYFDGGISLHGSYWHDLFGYRQSHGCVNMTISDARWLFEWTGQGTPDADGNIATPVYVYSSGEYGVTASGI